ncbi:MAG: thiopurine S-methyltransferase [Spirochaetia bacterium]|nr:thiopurine S-methyltransferase [Spirochaetia bacterium]
MELEFWKERWQNQQIGFHRSDVNPYLSSFFQEICSSCRNVIVPLCGKSLDMIWLSEKGMEVAGVEISDLAVKSFFTENSLEYSVSRTEPFQVFKSGKITIYCGDFFQFKTELFDLIDCVYDRASLIALPKEMRKNYLKIMKGLKAGSEIMLVSMEYPEGEMNGPPFSVPEKEVFELYEEDFTVEKIKEFNVMEENPQFKNRGLSSMHEKIYWIRKNH